MRKFIRLTIAVLCVSIAAFTCFACGETEPEPKEKTVLDSPVIASAVYTGEKQTAASRARERRLHRHDQRRRHKRRQLRRGAHAYRRGELCVENARREQRRHGYAEIHHNQSGQ